MSAMLPTHRLPYKLLLNDLNLRVTFAAAHRIADLAFCVRFHKSENPLGLVSRAWSRIDIDGVARSGDLDSGDCGPRPGLLQNEGGFCTTIFLLKALRDKFIRLFIAC